MKERVRTLMYSRSHRCSRTFPRCVLDHTRSVLRSPSLLSFFPARTCKVEIVVVYEL